MSIEWRCRCVGGNVVAGYDPKKGCGEVLCKADPNCAECGHPLENSEIRAGRCRTCGADLEDDEDSG